MDKQTAEGWQIYIPTSQRVGHFFTMDGRSLCGRVGFFNSETDLIRRSDDCKACVKRLEAREKKAVKSV